MLPILHSPAGSPDDLARVSGVCLAAWRDEIRPRLEAVLTALPDCIYPSILLRDRLTEAAVARLDAVAGEMNIKPGVALRLMSARIGEACKKAMMQLELNAKKPTAEGQTEAFHKVRAVRELLQELPRSVVIP